MALRGPFARVVPWLLLALVAAPAGARAGVPVGLYPLQAEGLSEGERAEVQAVVESALENANRRGVLEPRSPLVVAAACKAPITVGCVATLAKGGVVLYAKAKRRGAQILVTVLFVDGAGRKTRAAAFPVDLFIQNLRPANDAIATIEAELAAGVLEDPTPVPPPVAQPPRAAPERPRVAERPAPPPAERPAPPPPAPPRTPPPAPPEPPPVAAAPVASPPRAPEPPPAPPPEPPRAAPAAAPPPAAPQVAEPQVAEPAVADEPPGASVPIDLAVTPRVEPPKTAKGGPLRPPPDEPAGPPRDWRRTVGSWTTAGGIAMVVAGVGFGLSGQRLADTLEDRYARGQLRPADADLYDRVALYERLANVLLVGGGVATAAGVGLQAFAPPEGGVGVALAGRF